ncbi:MAG: DUF1385 domain-containing protein [Lachnospiraceae bacterium]
MAYSGIGGQAVLEGVMMKHEDQYAVAVRKPDQEIVVDVHKDTGICKHKIVKKIPILRGILNFIDSLVLGMKTLTYSAAFYDEEKEAEKETSQKKENLIMGMTVAFSIVLAVAVFVMLPYGIAEFFHKYLPAYWMFAMVEGMIRLGIFLIYLAAISQMEDIRRVFMYHGAEHKCINCIEHGMDLTVENVRKSSRLHKRCGTSFLLIVLLITILFFMFIRVESPVLRLVYRLLLVPVIAGVAYEFIRLAGRTDNLIIDIFSKPGLWLQRLTTREPDDAMIEVGIASVEAVFDWKAYLEEQKTAQTE